MCPRSPSFSASVPKIHSLQPWGKNPLLCIHPVRQQAGWGKCKLCVTLCICQECGVCVCWVRGWGWGEMRGRQMDCWCWGEGLALWRFPLLALDAEERCGCLHNDTTAALLSHLTQIRKEVALWFTTARQQNLEQWHQHPFLFVFHSSVTNHKGHLFRSPEVC